MSHHAKIWIKIKSKSNNYQNKKSGYCWFFLTDKLQNNVYRKRLLALAIESKTGFDQLIIDDQQKKILEQFDAGRFYKSDFYVPLIQYISNNDYDNTKKYLQNSNTLNSFWCFTKHYLHLLT